LFYIIIIVLNNKKLASNVIIKIVKNLEKKLLLLSNLKIRLEDDDLAAYKELAAKKLKLAPDEIIEIKINKKSLDCRDKKQFYYVLSLIVAVPENFSNKQGFLQIEEKSQIKEPKALLKERPIIIGFGPAGIFAALTFLEYGIKPIVFERGKKVNERLQDISSFENNRDFNPESNAQFGEGGAGAYSDGKLTTRIKETGYVAKVIETFIRFGASPEIAFLNKPHLGTDQLCLIIKNIREFILASGGEINFQSKVTDLIIENNTLTGVEINGEQKCFGKTFVFAIGHSARDTLQMFKTKGIKLEQKPFAVGVRLEHPAEIINLMQYGEKYQHHEKLGAADYSLTHQGAFSFCMCPGGEIINTSSENKRLVLNGMSNSSRNSLFSNAAIVAPVTPEDLGSDDPLAGLEFQRMIEAKAFHNWEAPAQNLLDFLTSTKSTKLRPNSFKMGTYPTNINEILPGFITNKLVAAFKYWQSRFPLFISDQAVMLAPETRTSSPVRIVRDEKRQATGLANFYPVGEGSGYSGGITSSAVDAIKTIEAICLKQSN